MCHKFYATVSEAEKQFLILGGKISYESDDAMKYCETISGRNDVGATSSSTKDRDHSPKESVENSDEEENRTCGNDSGKKSDRINCQICGVAFRTVKNCQTHSRIHLTNNYYPCSLCDEIFTVETDWDDHMVDHGGESERKKESTDVCKKCGIKLDSENDYCEACEKILESERNFLESLNIQTSNDQSYSLFSCDICGKRFR